MDNIILDENVTALMTYKSFISGKMLIYFVTNAKIF